MTSLQQGGASWLKFVRPVLFLTLSPRLRKKCSEGKVDLIVVETVPAGIKPPAADDSMCTSTGGKCGSGASAPSLTRASPMHFLEVKRGSAILPKLVTLVGPCHRPGQKRYPRASLDLLQRPPYACEASCFFYVCLCGETWLLSLMLQVC